MISSYGRYQPGLCENPRENFGERRKAANTEVSEGELSLSSAEIMSIGEIFLPFPAAIEFSHSLDPKKSRHPSLVLTWCRNSRWILVQSGPKKEPGSKAAHNSTSESLF